MSVFFWHFIDRHGELQVFDSQTDAERAYDADQNAMEGAPVACAACLAPVVWGDACRYCRRYRRPCGRHDAHRHEVAS